MIPLIQRKSQIMKYEKGPIGKSSDLTGRGSGLFNSPYKRTTGGSKIDPFVRT